MRRPDTPPHPTTARARHYSEFSLQARVPADIVHGHPRRALRDVASSRGRDSSWTAATGTMAGAVVVMAGPAEAGAAMTYAVLRGQRRPDDLGQATEGGRHRALTGRGDGTGPGLAVPDLTVRHIALGDRALGNGTGLDVAVLDGTLRDRALGGHVREATGHHVRVVAEAVSGIVARLGLPAAPRRVTERVVAELVVTERPAALRPGTERPGIELLVTELRRIPLDSAGRREGRSAPAVQVEAGELADALTRVTGDVGSDGPVEDTGTAAAARDIADSIAADIPADGTGGA